MKRISGLLLLLIGIGLLAGCMRVDADLTISEQDTVSGQVRIAVDREWASAQGSDPDTMFAPILQDLQEAPESGVTAEPFSDEDFVGLTLTLRHTPLERVSAATSGVLKITRAAGEYQVNGDFTGLAEQAGSTEIPPWQLDLSITFPDGVSKADGQISGSTVSWQLQQGAETLHARGPAPGAGVGTGWFIAIGAGVVLLAAGAWWLLRTRHDGAGSSGQDGGSGSSGHGGGSSGHHDSSSSSRHGAGALAGLRQRLAHARGGSSGRVDDLRRRP